MAPKTSNKPVYRVYNPNSGEHLYTESLYEANSLSKLGWHKEGIAFYSTASGKADYRLYNPKAGIGAHFETESSYERDQLVKEGWRYEGIAWYGSNATNKTSYVPPKTPERPAPSYFSQLDPRWGNVRLGYYPLHAAGCVPTSVAMILNGTFGMNVNPGIVAQRENNWVGSSFGTTGYALRNTVNSFGHQLIEVGSMQSAISYMQQGYPLIFEINVGIGHAVVAYNYKNGNVQVNDPYARKFYPSGSASLSSLWNRPATGIWDNNHPDPRPVFVIE